MSPGAAGARVSACWGTAPRLSSKLTVGPHGVKTNSHPTRGITLRTQGPRNPPGDTSPTPARGCDPQTPVKSPWCPGDRGPWQVGTDKPPWWVSVTSPRRCPGPQDLPCGDTGSGCLRGGGKVWGRKDRAGAARARAEGGRGSRAFPPGTPRTRPTDGPYRAGSPGDGAPGPRGCSQLGGNPQGPGRDLPSSAVPAGGGDPRSRPRPGASIHPGMLRAAPLYPSVPCVAGPPSPSCLGRAGCPRRA